MTFKTFDELFDEILQDYKNQFPEGDSSKGSLIFMKSACLAAARWGMEQKIKWVLDQIFPDKSDPDMLDRHAWVDAIDVQPDDSTADILAKVLDKRQNPPAGGNKTDYARWARSNTNVKIGYSYPLAMGLGTVVLLVIADEEATGSEIPSSHADITGTNDTVTAFKLIDAVKTFSATGVKKGALVKNNTTGASARVTAVDSETQLSLDLDIFTLIGQSYTVRSMTEEVRLYIEERQVVQAEEALTVMAPGINTQAVTMTVTGSGVDTDAIEADMAAYMNGLAPNKTLYLDQLRSIAINNGAESTNITAPAADVVPANYEMIRAGVIDVS